MFYLVLRVICKEVGAVALLSLRVMEGAVWRPSNDVMVILTVQMALMSFFVPVSKCWTVYVCPFVLFFLAYLSWKLK